MFNLSRIGLNERLRGIDKCIKNLKESNLNYNMNYICGIDDEGNKVKAKVTNIVSIEPVGYGWTIRLTSGKKKHIHDVFECSSLSAQENWHPVHETTYDKIKRWKSLDRTE